MKTCGGTAPPLLTSALDGGEQLASYISCFSPRKIVPGTHCIRGWVGPWAVLDAAEERNLYPPGIEPRCPACSPSLYCLSYPGSCQVYISYIHYSLGPCNLRTSTYQEANSVTKQHNILRSCMTGITVENKLGCSTAPYIAAVQLLQCICALPLTET
jgi:hypothetical protein